MKRLKKSAAAMLMVLMTVSAVSRPPLTAWAGDAPYTSMTFDKDQKMVRTADGYQPEQLWDKFGTEELKRPSDLFISKEGKIYIADTGNRRVLICDLEGNYLGEVTEGLSAPMGVFVTEDEKLYVADSKAQQIIVYSADGAYLRSYETPDSPLFGKSAKYAPTKLIVNRAGTIYALSEGNTNGILMISEYGDFYGYFGVNDTVLSLANRIKRTIFTQEQLSGLQKSVPVSAVNLDIDETGLIYTVSQGQAAGQNLRKLNMTGKNMLHGVYSDSLAADVAVGPIDNIFTVTRQGYILEYTREGRLLFCFSGSDDGSKRSGLFVNAVAVDVDSAGNLYVLDQDRGDITVFAATEYAHVIHEALSLYQEGLYLESRGPWEKVLEKNSLFDFAYEGIAESLYKIEDYRGTMKAARNGGAKGIYSDAFWQVRNQWLREHIVGVFWICLLLLILRRIWKRYRDRAAVLRRIHSGFGRIGRMKVCRELRILPYVIRNPADAFYGIKHEKTVSAATASLVYLLIFTVYILNRYCCGFLFKSVPDGYYNLLGDIVQVPGLMLLFVICCNMVCSIREGEATFGQCYCCFAYCFMPYLFIKPAVLILSHVLTNNEAFLITLLNFVMTAGTLVLIVVMVREIQCYTYKQTFISMFLTLFTMAVLVIVGVIVFILIRQVADFLVEIYKEGYYRGW